MKLGPDLHSQAHHGRGFTLIEIMVAIVILAGLSLLTAQAIRSGVASREKFNREILADSEVRDTLRVMERDINLAFHHRDIFTEMYNQIERDRVALAQKKAGQANPPAGVNPIGANPYAGVQPPQEKKEPKNLTAFVGDTQSVHFTALTNIRTQRDVQESEQAEVGYFLKSCNSRDGKDRGRQATKSSQCLYRRLSPLLDDDVTQGGNEVVLLENVQEFKLRYFGPQRDDWVENWKTGDGGDAISKLNFPCAVEVSLSVHNMDDPKARKVSMMLVAPIRFPNNPPEKKGEGKNAAPGATGTSTR